MCSKVISDARKDENELHISTEKNPASAPFPSLRILNDCLLSNLGYSTLKISCLLQI